MVELESLHHLYMNIHVFTPVHIFQKEHGILLFLASEL